MMRRSAAEARRPTQAGADSAPIVRPRFDHVRPARALRSTACASLLVAVAALGSAPTSGAARAAPHQLQTAIVDPAVFGGPDAAAGLDRAVAAGATAIKVPLFWNVVTPDEAPARSPGHSVGSGLRLVGARCPAPSDPGPRARADRLHLRPAGLGSSHDPRLCPARPCRLPRVRARRGPTVLGRRPRAASGPLLAGVERAEQGRDPGGEARCRSLVPGARQRLRSERPQRSR